MSAPQVSRQWIRAEALRAATSVSNTDMSRVGQKYSDTVVEVLEVAHMFEDYITLGMKEMRRRAGGSQ